MDISVFSRLQNYPTVSNGSFKAVDRLFQVDGPATAKLLGPKLTVLVVDTSRSPWTAERRLRRVEAASRGTVIDDTYGNVTFDCCYVIISLYWVLTLVIVTMMVNGKMVNGSLIL